mgnify:CR=1 FL=1
MATLYETAVMSQQAYQPNGGTPPTGWVLFRLSDSDPTGFQGAAYRNTLTNEIVVTARGTEPTQVGDLRADLQIGLGDIPAQYASAQTFYSQVLQQANADPNIGAGNYTIGLTGHSLGGGLMQLLGAATGLPTTTFNAPGAMDIWVSQFGGNPNGFYDNVNNYNTLGDIVHKWDQQIGSTVNILGSSFGAVPDGVELLVLGQIPALRPYYLYDQHSIDQFVDEFGGVTDNRSLTPILGDLLDTVPGLRDFFDNAMLTPASPIVLDLDGDGVETTGLTAGAYFDHDGNGFAQQTGWASPDDGMLVWDRNGDGRINNGTELFGNETLLNNGTKAANGFQALAKLDTNTDGKIDINDAAFANLKIWQDTDGDGYSATGELQSLADFNIQSINTGYTDSTYTDSQGNEHKQIGSFTKTDSSTGIATDIWFKTDPLYTIVEEWLDVPVDVAALPEVRGYGR